MICFISFDAPISIFYQNFQNFTKKNFFVVFFLFLWEKMPTTEALDHPIVHFLLKKSQKFTFFIKINFSQ